MDVHKKKAHTADENLSHSRRSDIFRRDIFACRFPQPEDFVLFDFALECGYKETECALDEHTILMTTIITVITAKLSSYANARLIVKRFIACMAEQKEIRRGKLINARPHRLCRADELVSWLYSDIHNGAPILKYFMESRRNVYNGMFTQFCWNRWRHRSKSIMSWAEYAGNQEFLLQYAMWYIGSVLNCST